MFYYFAWFTMRFLLWLLVRPWNKWAFWEVTGQANVPLQGPLIIVINHLNLMDPAVVASAFPIRRRIYFLAKEELFKGPISLVVRPFGAIPVRRGQFDREALRASVNHLKNGGALGIFPEGHRSEQHQLQEAHAGAALIALKTNALILPVAVTGTDNVFLPGRLLPNRTRITVTIGEPFTLQTEQIPGQRVSSRKQMQYCTTQIMNAIAHLLPPDHRGVYSAEISPLKNEKAS